MKTPEEAQRDLDAFFDSIEDPERRELLKRRQWAITQRLDLCKTQEHRNAVIQQMMMESFQELAEALEPFRTK
jgi:hypothetical protein